MARALVGDTVVVEASSPNLKTVLLRPALVLARTSLKELILCQITAQLYGSESAVPLTTADFMTGGLPAASYIRPDRLFTANDSIVLKTVGHLTDDKLRQVLHLVRNSFAI